MNADRLSEPALRRPLLEALQSDDWPRIRNLFSGATVGLIPEGVDVADLIRTAIPVEDRHRWDRLLASAIARELEAIARAPDWDVLDLEAAWNMVVVLQDLRHASVCVPALLDLEAKVQEAEPSLDRGDLREQIDLALIAGQRDGQLADRWRSRLAAETEPPALFRAFVGLIRVWPGSESSTEDAPVELVREALGALGSRLLDDPDGEEWLFAAATRIRDSYPAAGDFWASRIREITEPWPGRIKWRILRILGSDLDPIDDIVVRVVQRTKGDAAVFALKLRGASEPAAAIRTWIESGLPDDAGTRLERWGHEQRLTREEVESIAAETGGPTFAAAIAARYAGPPPAAAPKPLPSGSPSESGRVRKRTPAGVGGSRPGRSSGYLLGRGASAGGGEASGLQALGEPQVLGPLLVEARRLTGNSSDAKDLVQDTIERGLRHYDRFSYGSVDLWLVRIMRNLLIDRRRRQSAGPMRGVKDRDLPVEMPLPSPPMWMKVSDEMLRQAQATLHPLYREAFVKREIEGKSYKEIAQDLGVSTATVGTRVFRSRLKIREYLLRSFEKELDEVEKRGRKAD
jgi:RNA polymerase sigma-70 factor, ECF subfamily